MNACQGTADDWFSYISKVPAGLGSRTVTGHIAALGIVFVRIMASAEAVDASLIHLVAFPAEFDARMAGKCEPSVFSYEIRGQCDQLQSRRIDSTSAFASCGSLWGDVTGFSEAADARGIESMSEKAIPSTNHVSFKK